MAILLLSVCLIAGADEGGPQAVPFSVLTLSTQGSTRGTGYPASNKIVTLDDVTYMTWLDSVSIVRARTYDRRTRKLSPVVEVGRGHDNHGGPSLCSDSEGYLHIAYGPHSHPFQYRRTLRPGDITEWTPVERFGEKATYPSLVCDSRDTLHIAYRQSKDPWKLMYQQKPKGQPWSEPVALVVSPVPEGYTNWGNALALDKNDRLHLGFHIYTTQKYAAGIAFGYLYSDDHGAAWHTTCGNVLTLPGTLESCEPVEMNTDMDIRVGNLVADNHGTVYMTVVGRKPGQRKAGELWLLEDRTWRPVDLMPFLEAPWNQISDAVVSVTQDGTICVAVSSGAYAWQDPAKEIWLLISRDRGETFTAQAISEIDPDQPNWLPNIERNMGHTPVRVPHFLFTHGGPGQDNESESATGIQFVVLQNDPAE